MTMKPLSKGVVMVFGTFDLLHPGHLFFFEQAKKFGEILVVSVARDQNVKKIKGEAPLFSEDERMKAVGKIDLVDAVLLGDRTHYMSHIKRIAPDVIVLGYDQKAYTETLKEDLLKAGLATKVVRAAGHKVNIYKSSIIKARNQRIAI
jgi:FAD synthetase